MSKLRDTVLCCSLLLICAASLRGQHSAKKAESEDEQPQELLKKAQLLIEDVATGALSLRLPENRSFMLASAAELMWDSDEKRARSLFWEAHNTIGLLRTGPSDAKQSAEQKQRNLAAYYTQFALRRELLRKVATRDPGFAIDMLRSTHIALPEGSESSFFFPQEKELEQEIAAQAAAKDPKRALEIARESLSRGFSFQLLDLLSNLSQRDSETATKFAGDIIAKLQTTNLSSDHFAGRIAVDLVLWSRNVRAGDKWRALKLEPEQRRDLVQLIANSALGLNPNPNLLYALQEMMPQVQEFAPERVALLQKKLSAFNQTLNKDQKGWNSHNELVRDGNPEQMLRGSLQLDDEQRVSLQRQAAIVAIGSGRVDSFRETINTEILDESARRPLIDFLDSELISHASANGDADTLRKLLPKLRLREERARAMAEVAVLLEKKGDHQEAVSLLDEARTLVKIDIESETQSNALLALLSAYAVVDPPKAFSILEKTVDRINSELTKLMVVDKIKSTGIIKKGEIVLQESGAVPLDFMVFKYGGGIAALAKVDFERTRAAADRLSRNELRLMMRLMLARAIIEATRKPLAK